ncbi:MAG: nucleoside recognition protein, partial [Haloferacaceae archaeon]|nr:nucleoside recognition protein [Haloferacaceae archaeon]
MSATQLIGEIALRVLRISLLIVLGVYLANVAVDRGVIETIARGSRWLTRPAHLPDEVGTA